MSDLSTVEHFDWRTVIEAKPDTPPETIATLDKYFSQFAALKIKEGADGAKEIESQRCIKCDEPLTGFQALLLGKGGFEWGIAHGWGHCRACRWPCVAHHYVNDDITLRNFILQVHPDNVGKAA